MHSALPEVIRKNMIRDEDPSLRASFEPQTIDGPVILICGHRGRDKRCGVMGPLLEQEFKTAMKRANFNILGPGQSREVNSAESAESRTANVGLISHMGGHKFAGNLIVYIPRGFAQTRENMKKHPLAGKGIWYGRIEPRHAEGIIKETILNGTIIKELFRGGVEDDGRLLRLD
jgi:(2Fe-2S) ferredoxin